MVLGTDPGGGHVDISLVLKVVFEEVCFFMFLFILLCDLLLVDREKQKQQIALILGGRNVDIILVLIGFSEMRVLSQVSFLNDFFEKSKGEKRTWANPMSSKQWKSWYEIDNFNFLFIYVFFLFLKK